MAVVVLGMHRSGTSALTGVLGMLGCRMPATLVPEHASNLRGHWESAPVTELNDRILAALGLDHLDWFHAELSRIPKADLARFRREARTIIRNEFADSEQFVLKDPRVCRLVPFWTSALNANKAASVFVLQIRNPLEVGQSLFRRNALDPNIGQLVWLRHILDAEKATRGAQRAFCTYDQLLDNWRALADRLNLTLGLALATPTSARDEEISSFLSSELRHHSELPSILTDDPNASVWIRRAFEIMSNWAERGERMSDHEELDEIGQHLDEAIPAFSPIMVAGLHLQQDREALARQLDTANAQGELKRVQDRNESQAAKAQVAALIADRERLELEVKSLGEERDHLLKRMSDLSAHWGGIQAKYERAHLESEQLRLKEETSRAALVELEGIFKDAQHRFKREQVEFESALQAERQRYKDLLERRSTTEVELSRTLELSQTVEEKLSESTNRLSELESALRQRQEEASQAWAELDAQRQRTLELSKNNEELEAAGGKLQDALAKSDAWVFKLAYERTLQDQRAERLESQLEQRNQAVLDVERRQLRLVAVHEELRTNNRLLELELEEMLAVREEERKRNQGLVETAQREAATAQEMAAAAQEKIAELEQRNLILARDSRELSMKLERTGKFELRHAALEEEKRNLAAKLEEQELEKIESARQLADRFREIGQLSALIRDLESEQKTLSGNLKRHAEEIATLTSEKASANMAAQSERSTRQESERRLDERFAEILTLTNLYRKQETVAQRGKAANNWLRDVHDAIASSPSWWSYLPKRHRRRKQLERLARKGLFDGEAYLERYPDVREAGMDPLHHYIMHGMGEGREI